MEYVQLTLNDWLEMKKKLERELQQVKQSFVRIGYFLRKIKDDKLYEQDGYKTISEFAKAEYGLEESTVSRFMRINKEYSIDGYSERLCPEYAKFSRSQLEEMLKLPESDRQMIQPETPREDIRGLKKFNKMQPEKGIADSIYQLMELFYKENPDILNNVFCLSLEETKQLIEIVNPNGYRLYKKGMFYLMMYENKVSFKKSGTAPQDMKWEEFFERTWEIFKDAAAGPNTWKNYFEGEKNEPEQTSTDSGNIEEVPVFTRQKSEDGTVRASETGPGIEGTAGDVKTEPKERTGESIAECAGDNVRGIPRTDEVATVSEPERARKTDGTAKISEKSKGKKAAAEIAPAQKVPVNTRQKPISDTKIELPKEEPQVPGQRKISDYEGVVPSDFVDCNKMAENVSKSEENVPKYEESVPKHEETVSKDVPEVIVEEKRWTRKEYLNDCTPYGAAVYFYRWFRDEHEEAMEIISDMAKLEQWMKDKVDSNGREDE